MKRLVLFVLSSMIIGFGNAVAQTESTFEGESTSTVTSMQKMTSAVKTKNILAKMILKSVMKKVENNGLYTGTYESTSIVKGNKTKTYMPYNNSYMITEKNGDKMTVITYYPDIKKGYYTVNDQSAAQQQLELMRKGEVEKTGETMVILGRKCDVYKVKYEMKQDTAGTVSTTNLHNEFAICQDPSLPEADKEIVPGVKGMPLKFINNTVSQTTNEMLNFDVQIYIATVVKDIKARKVDDEEVSVPKDIKLVDADRNPKAMLKIIEEEQKYLNKNNKWVEKKPDEIKIYDNLNEDWEY